MHFSIHYLTEYHYDAPVTDNLNALRVRPATTATQRCDEFHMRIEPEARLGRHIDYFGTEVIEFGISTRHEHADDRRARARRDVRAARAARGRRGRRSRSAAYIEAAGEYAALAGPSRRSRASTSCGRSSTRRHAAGDARARSAS